MKRPLCRTRHTLVTAAQNRDPASAGLQSARNFFDDRRLARSANGQIADADDEATERAFAKDAVPIKKEPQLHNALVDKRETMENAAQKRRAHAVAALENDVDRELFEIFKPGHAK